MSAANSSSRGDLGEQVQRVSQPASPHSGAAAILVGVEDQERGTHAVHDHDLLAMRHCFACPSRDPQFLGFDLRRSGLRTRKAASHAEIWLWQAGFRTCTNQYRPSRLTVLPLPAQPMRPRRSECDGPRIDPESDQAGFKRTAACPVFPVAHSLPSRPRGLPQPQVCWLLGMTGGATARQGTSGGPPDSLTSRAAESQTAMESAVMASMVRCGSSGVPTAAYEDEVFAHAAPRIPAAGRS